MKFKQFNKKMIAGAAAALTLGIGTLAGVGAADAGSKDFVGAWEIAVDGQLPNGTELEFLNALVVSSDGTLVNTGAGARAGVGVWERTGKNEYTLHVVHPIDDAAQSGLGSDLVYDIVVDLTLSKDGSQATGEFATHVRSTQIVGDATGGYDVVYSGDSGLVGTVHYDRITIQRD